MCLLLENGEAKIYPQINQFFLFWISTSEEKKTEIVCQ